MRNCIVIPDSFKGTMTSMEVSSVMAGEIRKHFPECKVVSIPIADGGEGTVDCFLQALPGEKINIVAQDAYGEDMAGFYGRFGDTAIVEMASVAGMVSNAKRDTLHASTFGVGQLIDHAITHGAKKIVIGLGGSCTSDAGCGMASALGMRFYDEQDDPFVPTGGTLHKIRKLDRSYIMQKLQGVEIRCMCDTNKVMYGPDGAAYVYAPQKGASPEEVAVLDQNLKALAELIRTELGIDLSGLPGGGAAGAMGAGAVAFLGAELVSGIDYIMDAVGIDQYLREADCVFTGEGSFDAQSMSGKAVWGIAGRAARHQVPVIIVAGRNRTGMGDMRAYGISAIYETARSENFEEIKGTCREDLVLAMDKALNDIDRSICSKQEKRI